LSSLDFEHTVSITVPEEPEDQLAVWPR